MLKKFVLLISVILLFSFIGCKDNKKISSNVSSSGSGPSASCITSIESKPDQTEPNKETTENKKIISNECKNTTSSKPNTSTKKEVKAKKDNSSKTASSAKNKTTITQNNVSPEPKIQNATANDSKEIALLIAKHINKYRNEQNTEGAKILLGLNKYAEYRSKQLVSNFKHDTIDERAAATALKYGRYIEPSLYGMTGEPYYTACSGEAIIKASFSGSKENIAKSIASLAANSVAHWNYIGNPENKFIGVGVTYESGLWYCDIAVSDTNYDNERN